MTESDSEERVRYVEIAPPTGWQTMAKTVRGYDEDKIRDCKEDIDTLLVFAGLYSAVLSAFNIESYSVLLPDPNDQMIYLLERIAKQTQSYTLAAGMLNSTYRADDTPPKFTAPLWAVRINGLWFASLVISLATASIGILVKQWLREYLAIEWTSPQERLRARQYRKPGLDKWRVFEIAAILPLLLQISLGLFFAGLCIFTANTNEGIGNTSLVLVSGWAFFLLMTTVAPLFSPRCPYKIPSLRGISKTLRIAIFSKVRRILGRVLEHIIGAPKAVEGRQPSVDSAEDEEDTVVAGNQDDKDILISTDLIMADDNLLPTMWDAFKQRSPSATESLSFIVALILPRVGPGGEHLKDRKIREIPDLSALSRRGWDSIMGMLTELLSRRQLGPLVVSSSDWLFKTTLLLLSSSPYPLSNVAVMHLRTLLSDAPGWTAAKSLASWISPSTEHGSPFVFRPLYERLRPVYGDAERQRPSLLVLYLMYAEILRPYASVRPRENSLYELLYRNEQLFVLDATRGIVEDIWNITRATLIAEINSETTFGVGGMPEGLVLILQFGSRLGRAREAAELFAELWTKWPVTYTTLCYTFVALHPQTRSSKSPDALLQLSVNAFAASHNKNKLIMNSTAVAESYVNGAYDDEEHLVQMDALRFSYFHLSLYKAHLKHLSLHKAHLKQLATLDPEENAKDEFAGTPTSTQVATPAWSHLWNATASAVYKYADEERWTAGYIQQYWHLSSFPRLTPDELLKGDRELASKCLETIDVIEQGGHFDPSMDELRAALTSFIDGTAPPPEPDRTVVPGILDTPREPLGALSVAYIRSRERYDGRRAPVRARNESDEQERVDRQSSNDRGEEEIHGQGE